MHEVRVYCNNDRGTLWWAEDDLGFNGGADRLADLIESILEWVEAEGIAEADCNIQLVEAEPAEPESQTPKGSQIPPLGTRGTDVVSTRLTLVGT